MSDSSSQPQHREKLFDPSTGQTTRTGDAHAELNDPATPMTEASDTAGTENLERTEGAALHVSPIGENWEVENETGTLGQAESKVEAEELARELAEKMGAAKVTVHTSEGAVEKEIAIKPRPASLTPDA